MSSTVICPKCSARVDRQGDGVRACLDCGWFEPMPAAQEKAIVDWALCLTGVASDGALTAQTTTGAKVTVDRYGRLS